LKQAKENDFKGKKVYSYCSPTTDYILFSWGVLDPLFEAFPEERNKT